MLSPQARALFSLIEKSGRVVLLDSMSLRGAMAAKPHMKDFLAPARQAGLETGPEQIAALARACPGLKIIAAHLGCLYGWDRLEPLYDLDQVYFDLSFVHPLLSPAEAGGIIRRKGVPRILFGSDAPWRRPEQALAWFWSLPLDDGERASVLAGNLRALLGEVEPSLA